ncbi:hypothetical protein BGZ94_009438 [Podila epigama]|nr:hypothetical protein BGZ94_009438 [Podila epigama]
MADNRTLLEMLQGQQGGSNQGQNQGQGGHGQGQAQGQVQGQNQSPNQPIHHHHHVLHQQHQLQSTGDMQQLPMFHGMGQPPMSQMGPMGPMGPMMPPGFGFSGPGIDQHQMYLQMMQNSQHGSPMGHLQSGPQPPPQARSQPQNNARASLLLSLNQAVSPTTASPPTFNSTQVHSPAAGSQAQVPSQTQAQSQIHHPSMHQPLPAHPNHQAELQATTDRVKLALFGGAPLKQEPTAAQKQTEDLKMALFGNSRPEFLQPQQSPKKEETNLLALLQKSSNTTSPAMTSLHQEPTQEGVDSVSPDTARAKEPASSSRSTPPKESPVPPTSAARFTYVNPFHSFSSNSHSPVQPSSSSPPTSRAAATPNVMTPATPAAHDATASALSSKRSSVVAPTQRREAPNSHAEPVSAERAHDLDQKRYQVDQLLPPHSAWNHRVQKLAKGSSSVPDGVYIDKAGSAATVYDTGLDNLDAIFSEDLETIPITLIPTDVEYNHGRLVAVSKGYISYAAKGGKIRVIQQSHGHRTLLRGHSDQVVDMGFSAPEALDVKGLQLLASVGKDSRIIIWNLSGSDVESTDISHSKYMELAGVSQSDHPRFGRIAWNPAQPSVLAVVNNDEYAVWVVNVQKLMNSRDSPVVTEEQLLQHAIVIGAHEHTINDISFSSDGTVMITASEDGTVKFWEVNETNISLLHTFIPHGGLGVTNAILVDHPEPMKARCVVTACRRGTDLGLFQIAHAELLDQFIFKEPPSATRRSSLAKGGSRLSDMRMFNFMGFDHETSSLVLANSARLSLFGLKVTVTSTESEPGNNGLSQAEYLRQAIGSSNVPRHRVLDHKINAKFDFMIEYPMPQPVVSFVVQPDSSLENNGFSVYCIQAKSVQQYIIKGLEPHDKHKCNTFVSAAPATKQSEAQAKGKSSSRASTPKASNSNSNSPSIKINDGTDSTFKSVATSGATGQGEVQEKEPLKLHGPVINGAIAKLKEKRRSSANAASSDNSATNTVQDTHEKRELNSGSASTSGRATRKSSQDLGEATQQQENKKAQTTAVETKAAGDASRSSGRTGRAPREAQSSPLEQTSAPSAAVGNGHISISVTELQAMLRTMEDKISTRFEKKLTAELEQQARRVEEDQISRQEAVLKMVSQSLAKNTEQLLVQTVHKEIQSLVVPSLNKVVGAAVERQLGRAIGDATLKALPVAVDSAVSENVERVMTSPSFVKELTAQVASSIRPSIEESFKDSFTKVLIPSYQKATQAMFQQIHVAFQSGIEDLTSANQRDHEAVESLSLNVKKLTLSVEAIQSSVAQVAQAQSDQALGGVGGGAQRPDMRSSVSGLQRALQGGSDENGAHGSRRASQQQQMSPMESKQMATLNQLIAHGDFEEAFTQALSTNDSSIVYHICSKVSPRTVFQQTPTSSGSLSQPVLLALAHHLANEQLGQGLGTKLTWLQEILMRLNPKDPMLGDHMSRILPNVQRRLSETYTELINSTEPSPHIHTTQRLLAFVESMQL